MKTILSLLALALLIGGVWYFYQNTVLDTPTGSEVETNTEEMDSDTEMDDMETESETTLDTEVDVAVDMDAQVFTITGENFAFSETEIRVQEGDTVTINFTSTGGFHDWVVDEFDAATARVNTDGTTSVTFVADTAGTYEYYCSVGNHRAQGMVGTLIVE